LPRQSSAWASKSCRYYRPAARMHLMAKAAVAVYEAVVDEDKQQEN
jgi:hypothetical protein